MAQNAPDVISAQISKGALDVTRRLAARAKRIAIAHGENAIRSHRSDPSRWRKARLLWPLFRKAD
ncbi:hypothetical protein GRI41_10335 [Altererythrobacter aquaemixtae]|uniref:Uncharacterized protein n=1 Tax=Pontixanthobacter aquaemixtae TaxID=1958940 RepID=A0A844ZVB8_9SPHN|nr:hypothetical protein [Pontixanthobacter aquaemixtae]